MNNNLRYLILTPGRSGSSILSAILADAGADFGMEAPDDWDRTGGSLEHPLIVKAAKTAAVTLAAHETTPMFGLAKMDWKLRRFRVKRMVNRALKTAAYFKASNLEFIAGPAIKLGYDVCPIISLRDFDSLSSSMLRWPGAFRSFRGIERAYINGYESALSMLYAHGGCYVDYDELTDREQVGWAERLSRVTGLDPERLLAARDKRVSDKKKRGGFPLGSERAETVYRAIIEYGQNSGQKLNVALFGSE